MQLNGLWERNKILQWIRASQTHLGVFWDKKNAEVFDEW